MFGSYLTPQVSEKSVFIKDKGTIEDIIHTLAFMRTMIAAIGMHEMVDADSILPVQ